MAIIDELSSDEDHPGLPNKPVRDASRASKPAGPGPSCSRNPVEELLAGRASPDHDALLRLLESQGTSQTWLNILATADALLANQFCDTLNINRLDGLTATVALFAEHADAEQLAQAGDADGRLGRVVDNICDLLKVPTVFLKEDYAITSQDAEKQTFWIAGSVSVLRLLKSCLHLEVVSAFISSELDWEAKIVITLSKYTALSLPSKANDKQNLDTWITPLSNQLASDMLLSLSTDSSAASIQRHRLRLSKHILLSYIKPLFTATPHPMLNPETGRKLDRCRGGDLFGDSYMDGEWRGQSVNAVETGAIGCWRTYLYVLTLIDKEDFEDIWPQLVPPMMTLLDDHQIYFKHQGILAVSVFLTRSPAVLLQRTGLQDLIQQSLTTAFSFTSEAANVPMIRDAITTNLQLVNLMYPKPGNITSGPMSSFKPSQTRKHVDPPALVRFNTLCSIYHGSVINFFTYASSSLPFMTLAFESIPLILNELGKGSIRFLQDSMTVLCSSLGGSPASKALSTMFSSETVKMHTAAGSAIIAFIDVCRDVGRIERWRGMINSSIATLWCNIKEQNTTVSTSELEDTLKRVIVALNEVCGEVAIKDCQRMRDLDPALFSELFIAET